MTAHLISHVVLSPSMCKLINRKISGGHGWLNQIWKKKAHEGYKTVYPQSERSVSNFCSPFPEVHRACPTPIDRSPKNIEGFENILAEQKKKQEYLKRCYHFSWNHENVTSPRLALRLKMTSSFRKFIYFKIMKIIKTSRHQDWPWDWKWRAASENLYTLK